jgi:hypothetical protein
LHARLRIMDVYISHKGLFKMVADALSNGDLRIVESCIRDIVDLLTKFILNEYLTNSHTKKLSILG